MSIYISLIILILGINISTAQVAVIANKSVPVDEISATQLLDFYTGETRFWGNKEPVIVYDLEPKGKIKKTFYKFLGKSTARMKSIWMKNMLSGEGGPPQAISTEQELLKVISNTKGSVGFISYDKVNQKVKVLAVIELSDD